MFEGSNFTSRERDKTKKIVSRENVEASPRQRLATILELAESGDIHGRRYTEGLGNPNTEDDPLPESNTEDNLLPERSAEIDPLPEPNYDEDGIPFITIDDAFVEVRDDEFESKGHFNASYVEPPQDNFVMQSEVESSIVTPNDVVQPNSRIDSKAFNIWLEDRARQVVPEKKPDNTPEWSIPSDVLLQMIRAEKKPSEKVQGQESSDITVDKDFEAFKDKYPSGALLSITEDEFVINVIIRSHKIEVDGTMFVRAAWLDDDSGEIRAVKLEASKLEPPRKVDLLRDVVKDPFDQHEVTSMLKMDFQEVSLKLEKRRALKERIDAFMATTE